MSPIERLREILVNVRFGSIVSDLARTEPRYEAREYEAIRSPNGVVIKLRGIELLSSSSQDFSYFNKSWLDKPGQLETDRAVERDVQQAMLGHNRNYSGWYGYRHIEQTIETLCEHSQMVGATVSLPSLIGLRGHDLFEDDPEVDTKMKEWEALTSRKGGNLRQIQSLEEDIARRLVQLKEKTEQRFKDYVPSDIKDRDRKSRFREVEEGVDLMWGLTRAKYQDIYPYSISQIFTRGAEGHEKMLKTFIRANGKVIDRLRNVGDYTPIPQDIAHQINLALDDKNNLEGIVIGEELTRRFGGIAYGREMPPAVKVNTAFNSLFVFQYAHEQLINKYGAAIIRGRYSPKVEQQFRLMEVGLRELLQSTLNLLDSAIRDYESDPDIISIKGDVDKKVEAARQNPEYQTKVTPFAPVQVWLHNDARGKSYIEALDQDTRTRQAVYESARLLRVFFPQFSGYYEIGGDKSNLHFESGIYTPLRHNLFTVDGLEGAIEMQYGPRSAKIPIISRAFAGKLLI